MQITDTKPHYLLLDGLRGVASILVICFHLTEAFCTSAFDQILNHGYLAVDFFFILSGFVMGYAYDERWGKGMSIGNFFKRRLIRLHPMVIAGAIIGAITFCIQGSQQWDHTKVATSAVMLSMLMAMFLIPSKPGAYSEIRGNGEMFPINGPSWSLFFEYIGNILYALLLRRLSTKALRIVVILSGILLTAFALLNGSGYGHIGVGWSVIDFNLLGGFLRMFFAYSMGLLLSRGFKPMKIRNAFIKCTIILIVVVAIPHIGTISADDTCIGKPFSFIYECSSSSSHTALWLNGLYDILCVAILFPLVVYMGASGQINKEGSIRACQFIGDLSYPLYITHYPFMYLFYNWVWNKESITNGELITVLILLPLCCMIIAYALYRLYDRPIRKILNRRFTL